MRFRPLTLVLLGLVCYSFFVFGVFSAYQGADRRGAGGCSMVFLSVEKRAGRADPARAEGPPDMYVGPEAAQWQSRDLLRVFGSRGNQGIPYVDVPGVTTTTDVQSYATPLIIVAAIGVGIAVICILVACIIWCCRCCCGNCCKGDTDPERNYLLIRLIILAVCVLVVTGAFLGLYGGKLVSDSVDVAVNDFQSIMTAFIVALRQLSDVRAQLGLDANAISEGQRIASSFAASVTTAQNLIVPLDAARLALLYLAMALGMLAAITLAVGGMLR